MLQKHNLFSGLRSIAPIAALLIPLASAAAAPNFGPLPERITFPSADGHTMLVGYVFKPQGQHAARMPVVVMMHGRAGSYSSLANGRSAASTLSMRHKQW